MNGKFVGTALAAVAASTLALALPASAGTPPAAHPAVTSPAPAPSSKVMPPKTAPIAVLSAGTKYADELVAAWGRGDAKEVAKLATPEVDKTLTTFAKAGGPAWVRTSTHLIGDIQYVSYLDSTRTKALVIGVNEADAAKAMDHAATIARFVAHPARPMTADRYTGVLIQAWGRGDAKEVAKLASPAAAAALEKFAKVGGAGWVRTASVAGHSSTTVTFGNAAKHEKLVLTANNKLVLANVSHAVTGAAFSAVR